MGNGNLNFLMFRQSRYVHVPFWMENSDDSTRPGMGGNATLLPNKTYPSKMSFAFHCHGNTFEHYAYNVD